MRRLLPLVALLAACSQGPAPTGPGAGKAYFKQVGCASCHRVGSDGSATGPDLTFVGFRHTPEWLDLFLKDPQAWKPDTLMPNRRLPDEARKAIVEYLASLQGQDAPPGKRSWDEPSLLKDSVARGRVIYARAGCVACHGLGGQGGYPNNNVKGGQIPSLVKVADGYTKAELVAKIRRGVVPEKADPKGPEPLVRMPAWGQKLDDAELDALASYLLGLTPASSGSDGW